MMPKVKKILIKNRSGDPIQWQHPWIYRSQILDSETGIEPGAMVEIMIKGGRSLGMGYYNPRSEISVRRLSDEVEPADEKFFEKKLNKALVYRKRHVSRTDAYRIVSSEADGLPGMIVDRYGSVLVVQFMTLGMEKLKLCVLKALQKVVPGASIYERSDSRSRALEGLKPCEGWVGHPGPEESVISENGLQFTVRFGQGHKTGMYLDQRENRLFLAEQTESGQRVLDVFCHEGAFGLHLAKKGCYVTGVEIQKEALMRAQAHARLNEIPEKNCEFVCGNAFDLLRQMARENKRYDLIILDPPSFAKKKIEADSAVAGYKEIMVRSLKMLGPGGRLAAFSCSYHLNEGMLLRTCLEAGLDTDRRIKLLRFMTQSSDHPICPAIPETFYLKGYYLEVDD